MVGSTLLMLVIFWMISAIQSAPQDNAGVGLLIFLATTTASTFASMGLTAFFIRAHDDVMHVSLNELWHPQQFWQFLAVSILVGIASVIGLILLIIPGLILITMFAFAKLLVIDRAMGPIDAMKESMRLTKGSRLKLFLLLLALLVINILGALTLLIGLLVTIPVSMLALTHAYRSLSHKGTHHPNTTQLPHAPNTSAI